MRLPRESHMVGLRCSQRPCFSVFYFSSCGGVAQFVYNIPNLYLNSDPGVNFLFFFFGSISLRLFLSRDLQGKPPISLGASIILPLSLLTRCLKAICLFTLWKPL
ncbi:hypothetical protein XENOCAPTIV_011196 [Xenoophorus captivus]|uniref:Uncharacterized protein n=1 Tax=Xenoophorus captivus TaxID=1517983 RepID=A0ABV0QD40_9TELE